MITLVLICYASYTAVMYLMTLCLYCCPGKRVSRYLGDLHASGLIVGLNCRSPDQKHPVKINILLLLILLLILRASAYEKYKDTCRTDKRKGDDREAAFGVGLVHACVHASMRPFKSLAVYHMKPVTSARMYQQLDKRDMSVTPLI